MPSEVLSTARPTKLRIAGFACVVLGAVAAGVGATREWATVGFAGDTEGALDVPWNGIDVWEGKVVVLAATAALLVTVAMRISSSAATRRGLAIGLVLLGALCVAFPVADAVRAEDRFGSTAGADLIARTLAIELELPEEIVREQLAEQLEQDLRVETESGLWLTAAGGALLIAGGVLSLWWVRRSASEGRPI